MDLPSSLVTAFEEKRAAEAPAAAAMSLGTAENYVLQVEHSKGLIVRYTLIDRQGVEVWRWTPGNEANPNRPRSVANDNKGNLLDT